MNESLKLFKETVDSYKQGISYYTDAGTANNGDIGNQQTVVVICNEEKEVLVREYIGDFTNNEGELAGIITCLEEFKYHKPAEKMLVYTDSKIAEGWTKKGWGDYQEKSFKKGKLTTRHRQMIRDAHTLYKECKGLELKWVPRDENKAGQIIEEELGL